MNTRTGTFETHVLVGRFVLFSYEVQRKGVCPRPLLSTYVLVKKQCFNSLLKSVFFNGRLKIVLLEVFCNKTFKNEEIRIACSR